MSEAKKKGEGEGAQEEWNPSQPLPDEEEETATRQDAMRDARRAHLTDKYTKSLNKEPEKKPRKQW